MKKPIAAMVAAVLSFMVAAGVGAQVDASTLSGPLGGMGPRSAAMGGAFVAVADDATALYWNPAGLAEINRLQWNSSIVGRVESLDVLDDAQDVYDIITETAIPALDFDFIRSEANRLAGQPVRGEVAAISAIGFRNAALGAYGVGGGQGQLTYQQGNPLQWQDIGAIRVYNGEAVAVTGTAVWQYSTGAGLSHRVSDSLAVGATVRKMHVGYRAKNWTATVDTTTPPYITTQEPPSATAEDTTTTADVGVLYSPEPRVKLAAVVRNVTSPNITLRDRTGAVVVPVVPVEADPVIDLGLAITSEDGKRTLAFDMHNIGAQNGGSGTVHFGYECRASSLLTLRVGASESIFAYGLGLDLGFLRLDLAYGTGDNNAKQAGASAAFEF